MPAVSPDGKELAFSQAGEIMVLSFEGGPIRRLTDGAWPRWGPDGYIYVLADNVGVRIRAAGGSPEPITQLVEGEQFSWVSDVLPGGGGALAIAQLSSGEYEIRALRFDTGESVRLRAGVFPRYAASGHMMFITSDNTLMAAPFDPRAMEITGPSVPLVEGVTQYALSEKGDLVYIIGGGRTGELDTELVWVTRGGAVTPAGWTFIRGNSSYGAISYGWRLSPDGTQVATRTAMGGNHDIWVKELPNGLPRRLTVDEGDECCPWWTPDGQTVTYLAAGNVWSTPADGTGDPTSLLDVERAFAYGLWSPDGEWLVLRTTGPSSGASQQPERDILALRPGVDSVPIPLVATAEFAETGPALSGDGRWLAYTSTETGRYEVWVRPFPNVGTAKYSVSTEGGFQPRWAHSGSELFYLTYDREVVAVQTDTVSGFDVVGRQTLFTVPEGFLFSTEGGYYDVAPNDQRFLMARAYQGEAQEGAGPRFILVQNFFEVLKDRVPN